MAVRLPGDGGLSLGLLWHSCVVTKRGTNRHVHFQDGQSAALCIRTGHKYQGLTDLPIGRLWVAPVYIISVKSIVIVLCVLHMLVLITTTIRASVAHYVYCVVIFRHIQVARTSREVGQRKGKQGVWVWAGERGLGKQGG